MIGTVVERHVESYKLDIGGPEVSRAPNECTHPQSPSTTTNHPLTALCGCLFG